MLQALLSLRHPGVKFEVVNAAMTAINSHVILPIARDCRKGEGDIWVLYIGNNEVVGPFGAGTVFGSKTPPLAWIRASIALKRTRIGQLFDLLLQHIQASSRGAEDWGGMEMFLNRQVRADAPEMTAVYRHFKRNLCDIISEGRRAGAGVVVSTVAVNLNDCAPFSSARRPNLSEREQKEFDQLYRQAIQAQESRQFQEAAVKFQQAVLLDDRMAELRFRQAECALALGAVPEAQREFCAARDLDTLRFRCDSRMNNIIRDTTTNWSGDAVLLADAESALAEESPDGLCGRNFFYEHAHLNFDGNYRLARTIAAQIDKLLPRWAAAAAPASNGWPSESDCARRLGWSQWSEFQAFAEITSRLARPPFTNQLNHGAQVEALRAQMNEARSAVGPEGLASAIRASEAAEREVPDDAIVHEQMGLEKEQVGDLEGAIAEAQRAADLLPSSAANWTRLGVMLAERQRPAEALTAFQRAVQLDSHNVWSLRSLALAETMLGQNKNAIGHFRQALALNPRYGLGWLGLGTVLEQDGRKAEAAECFRAAMTNRVSRPHDLVVLARFCRSRGWFAEAAAKYDDAIVLAPWDATLRMDAGRNLSAWGHHEDAATQYASVLKLAPALEPAHLELGLALMRLGRNPEAFAEFEWVLARDPGNAPALDGARRVRAQ
jgi:tetratricopeptide (TPR) repeat protein